MIHITDSWFTIETIDSKTYAISEYGHWEKVHSYLLIGNHTAALIDTGLGIGNIKNITDKLTNLPVKVLTTHVHWDHIGGHRYYSERLVHEADSSWLSKGLPLPLTQIRNDVIRDITIPLPNDFHIEAYYPFVGEPSSFLKDGDILNLGDRSLQILHTPGHSSGHITIFDLDNGYLFTGDLLYDTTPIYANYPSTNPKELVQSLERISHLDNVTGIFPGHNTLSLPISIFQEIKYAVRYLSDNDLIHFATGLHSFQGFQILF